VAQLCAVRGAGHEGAFSPLPFLHSLLFLPPSSFLVQFLTFSSTSQDTQRAREIYRACLKLVPHKKFTFAKCWIQFAEFELRQQQLDAARKVMGMAIGMAPKEKVRFLFSLSFRTNEDSPLYLTTALQGVHRARAQASRVRPLPDTLPEVARGSLCLLLFSLLSSLTLSLLHSTTRRTLLPGSSSPNLSRSFKITTASAPSTSLRSTNPRWTCRS
jgi:hypothetical protein